MIIYGRNPVKEALLGMPEKVEEVLISDESKGDRLSDIVNLAKEKRIKLSFLPQKAIAKISATQNHQGIIARISEFEYSTVEDILDLAKKRNERTFAVILDHLEDPHNLGAIIRTVNALGGHGVIIPKDRAAGVTPAVVKASAGATSFVPVAKVVNLVNTMKELKKRNIWIVGADASAPKPIYEESLANLDLALVIGNEGKGLGRLVKEECDFLVSIPNTGEVSSLNASVAAGIMIYEVLRQRKVK